MISNDHSCPRSEFLGELISEFWAKVQSRRQRIGIDWSAFAGHPHPSSFFPRRGESACFSGGSFKHCEHMAAEATTANLQRRATDWITIAINIHRMISRAQDDRNRSLRT